MSTSLVYFDLDGVIFDFDYAYDHKIGVRKPNGDVHWDLVKQVPDFFESMPLMPRALELWDMVPAERRRILSSIPKSVEVSGDQKRVAVWRHLGRVHEKHIHLVRGKKLKKAFALPGQILIDDWEQNVLDWRDGGGIGLHYHCHGYADHPTQKPLEILKPLLSYSVPALGTVLDPFCGAGSTLVAAKSLGLKGIGIEVQERYAEAAARRLSQGVLAFA